MQRKMLSNRKEETPQGLLLLPFIFLSIDMRSILAPTLSFSSCAETARRPSRVYHIPTGFNWGQNNLNNVDTAPEVAEEVRHCRAWRDYGCRLSLYRSEDKIEHPGSLARYKGVDNSLQTIHTKHYHRSSYLFNYLQSSLPISKNSFNL